MSDEDNVTHVYPLDIFELGKGQRLTAAECRKACVADRSGNSRQQLLRLRRWIERTWRAKRGEIVTVVCDHDGLRICTDSEALVENERILNITTKRQRKGLRQTLAINRGALTASECDDQEKLALKFAAYLKGGKSTARVALKAWQPSTPPMIEAPKGEGE